MDRARVAGLPAPVVVYSGQVAAAVDATFRLGIILDLVGIGEAPATAAAPGD